MNLDALGHIGYLLIFVGMCMLGARNKYGWGLRLLGDSVWCGVGVALGMTSIWIWSLLFMTNDVLSYRRWARKVILVPFPKREVSDD